MRKLTFGAKVVKAATKVSVFITVMTILIAIPVGVLATVFYAYKMDIISSLFYAFVTILLLKIREKVVG